MPDSRIVDAWALMAWIRDEKPASTTVQNRLQQAEVGTVQLLMSWVNAGEVYYMLARKHSARVTDSFLKRLPSLPIRLVLPDEGQIIQAATLKSFHRLSYADAFAVSLSIKEDGAIITGDPEMLKLANESRLITVEWIGRSS